MISISIDRAPRFIILGVQKCGTTALYDYLCLHSKVRRAQSKETHYFDWRLESAKRARLSESQRALLSRWGAESPCFEAQRAEMGPEDAHIHGAYRLLFPLEELLADPGLVSGEATPSYLLMGRPVAERIARHAPDARFVVAVRDPVKRAYSQYNMTRDPVGTPAQLQRRGFAELGDRSFDQVVDEELRAIRDAGITAESSNDAFQAFLDSVPWRSDGGFHGGHSWLLRGLYALQMRIFLEFFPPEAFCVVELEDLAADPLSVMFRIHRHLGIEEEPLPASELVPKNARSYQALSAKEQELTEFYQPFAQKWEEMCLKYGWKVRSSENSSSSSSSSSS